MFAPYATDSVTLRPVAPDWTIRQLVAWIADDDVRSHDEALRPVLTAVLAGLAPDDASTLRPQSPVALVRAVASHLRAAPALSDIPLRDVAGGTVDAAVAPPAAVTGRPAAASVHRPRLRLS